MAAGADRLLDVARDFATEEQCLAHLERMRWPDGVRCVRCGSDRISQFVTKEGTRKSRNGGTGEIEVRKVPARRLYQCLECKRQFTALVRTVFNDTHLPLRKWFLAVALILQGNGGLSAKRLQRELCVSYRTACYVAHRIRRAMEDDETRGRGEATLMDGELLVESPSRGRKRGRLEKQSASLVEAPGLISRSRGDA